MLLRQEVRDGIEVLSVRGPVHDRDAEGLLTAVQRALALEPRGLVLDLCEATSIDAAARDRLRALMSLPSGWPRAALLLCPGSAVPGAPEGMTARDREAALKKVDARARRPREHIRVPHDPSAPAQARAAVAECTRRMGLNGMSDDLALVVSEMVTNAVRHAAPPVSVEIEASEDDVVVAVCDGSPDRPVPREADDDAEGGRGMLLVNLLTVDHGVRPQPPGKTVWARLPRGGKIDS